MKKLLLIFILFTSKVSFAQWQLLNLVQGGTIYKAWDLCFINDSMGFAASFIDEWGAGAIWKTTDGAASWVKTDFPNAIKDISFINNDTGFAVGNGGYIYRTNNEGISWDSINIMSPWWELKRIYFKTPNESYIGAAMTLCMTCDEVLFKSTDQWQTFNVVHLEDTGLNTPDSPVESIFFCNNDTGFILADNNIWRTIDNGSNWDFNYQVGNQGASFLNCFYNSSSHEIFITGRGNVNQTNPAGMIHTSIDFGNYWAEVFLPLPVWGLDSIGTIFDGQFVTGNIGYITGGPRGISNTDGAIARTTDGGQTWTDENIIGNNGGYLPAMDCPSAKVCYVGGYNGVILKNTNADLGTSVTEVTASHNSQLVFYPNPVSSTATIEYKTMQAGASEITVTNTLGQVVLQLPIENKKKQTINISQLASGIYFVSCFDGKEQVVVKVVKE